MSAPNKGDRIRVITEGVVTNTWAEVAMTASPGFSVHSPDGLRSIFSIVTPWEILSPVWKDGARVAIDWGGVPSARLAQRDTGQWYVTGYSDVLTDEEINARNPHRLEVLKT